MQSLARTLLLAAATLLILINISIDAFAETITISNKGLYQIIPSENAINDNNAILALKDYALIEKTEKIDAIMGASFGFEFSFEGKNHLTTLLRVTHPKLPTTTGIGYTTIHSFPIILKPEEKYFAGWNFSEDYELQPGKWSFRFDFPDSPVCDFEVIPVEELVYDGNRLERKEPYLTDPPIITAKTSDLPYGGILTRYLVRGGIYASLTEAREGKKAVEERGFSPFIFVREKVNRDYWYYLFIKMFNSKEEATEFATKYRQKYRRKAVPQKVQLKLAPMN